MLSTPAFYLLPLGSAADLIYQGQRMRLHSRRVLHPDGRIGPASLVLEGERIAAVEAWAPADGEDLGQRLLAPGLVDIHGDAFERCVMPRPGVMVDPAVGLLDADRQLAASGITTALHGLTWSWEPGLRSTATGRSLLATLGLLRPSLLCDHRWHLRFEAFNLDGLDEALALIRERQVQVVAWNDHTPAMVKAAGKPTGNLGNAIRSGLSVPEFNAMAQSAHARAAEVGAALECLAAAARAAGTPFLSHDDSSPETRQRFRALGSRVSEFPQNLATAREAARAGEDVVMGAPNVLRGRSHMGWLSAEEAVAERVCTILASDYYYPALLQAPYLLAARGLMELGQAWQLVSANPARAAGLAERGRIAPGARADLVVVEDGHGLPPRVMATIVGGRRAFDLHPAG